MSEEMLYSEQYERVVYDYLLKNTRNGNLKWNVSIEKSYREDVPAAEVFTLRDLANVKHAGQAGVGVIHVFRANRNDTLVYFQEIVSPQAARTDVYYPRYLTKSDLELLYDTIRASFTVTNSTLLAYYKTVENRLAQDSQN